MFSFRNVFRTPIKLISYSQLEQEIKARTNKLAMKQQEIKPVPPAPAPAPAPVQALASASALALAPWQRQTSWR